MGSNEETTRQYVERILNLARRTLSYWWVASIVFSAGAVMSVVFALSQPPQYESETVLLYQELISQSILRGREVSSSSRAQATRYKEMLTARSTLRKVIAEYDLFPGMVVGDDYVDAVEEMRPRVVFRSRGAGTFRIGYRGDTPEQAKVVTARLADILINSDSDLRRRSATSTSEFLVREKERAEDKLADKEMLLAKFLGKHPEFAAETMAGATTAAGATIRAASRADETSRLAPNPEIAALERRRQRLQARLQSARGGTVPPRSPAKTAATRAMEQNVRQAERDLKSAELELETKRARFTERHPDVAAAKARLAASTHAFERAKAVMPGEGAAINPVAPTRSRNERKLVLAQLQRVEAEISSREREQRAEQRAIEPADQALQDSAVQLETEFAGMLRDVDESRGRIETLDNRVFTAQITASSQAAQSARLVIIDSAFTPHRPAGSGRVVVAMAGSAAFALLGIGLALVLALIDDRIFARDEVEALGVAPVLAFIPSAVTRRRWFGRKKVFDAR